MGLMRLYISYSRRNAPFVEKLTNELQKQGIEFWIDTAQLKPGDNFQKRMDEGLRGADAILVVLSPASVASEWVRTPPIYTDRTLWWSMCTIRPSRRLTWDLTFRPGWTAGS